MSISDSIWQFFICAFLLTGGIFCFGGSIGLLRFPDVFCRMQALSKPVTLGIFNLIIASVLFLFYTDHILSLKGILAIIFLLITVPLGTHMMAKSAYTIGTPMWTDSVKDELQDQHESHSPEI